MSVCSVSKIYYSIEDQVNDCFEFLGDSRKNAYDMTEDELQAAEAELKQHFEWVEHPCYYQAVPRYIATGEFIM